MLFLRIAAAEFLAELGDKTQLMLIALMDRYKLRDILIGTVAAILVLCGGAVFLGGAVGALVPMYVVKFLAGAVFIAFAVNSGFWKETEDKEETEKKSRISFAPAAVFLTFFLAELGDKTQLVALTFGANEGIANVVIVWLACATGLFAADLAGMAVGYFLKGRMPERVFRIVTFLIFTIYGSLTIREAVLLYQAR